MKEHPIPQDIVGYRFHIIGNMTIKQFAEIGAGVLIAFILYQTNLAAFVKWPLMGLSFAAGAALAFVPFEERPLDHWFITFIKVLYRPTKYYWKRSAHIPDPFLYQPQKRKNQEETEIDLSPARRERIKEYMLSLQNKPPESFDQERQRSLSSIMNDFYDGSLSSLNQDLAKPRLQVRVRNLRQTEVRQAEGELAEVKIIEEQKVGPKAVDTSKYQEHLRQAITLRTPLTTSQVAQDIYVPEERQISTGMRSISDQTVEEKPQVTQQTNHEEWAYVQNNAPTQDYAQASQTATFNQDLPFPTRPEKPNKIVGMVLTPNNELINDAVVEIKNSAGQTVRAVKTNALGQFFITTPLGDGTFTIETEKDDCQFTPVSLQLSGDIVEPVEVRSIS